MLHYSRLQLATIVAVPIVSIVLLWTVVIFYKNRKSWRCFDTAIVAIIIQSILRNISIIIYTVLQMINQSTIKFEYCTIFVWIFNSIHTFQASTLSTLAVIALFSIRLYRKKERLKNYLTVAHMVYHLFCLTTLCACVGVAAILAKQKNKEFVVSFDFFPLNLCKFMPYEMDVKYNVFIITLHSFLGFISLVAFILTCYNFYACKKDCFDYVKKSNSDLSELSLASQGYPRNFLEVYKTEEAANHAHPQWTSDTSNISTTVSSTNSRRPCLGKRVSEDEVETVGLETILPILTVCYLFNHIPVIVLCLFPWFIAPWSVATAALCLGLLQDILVPLSLGLVDTRFCQWVSNVYRCSERETLNEKLPQVGLDGKFRPFGGHNPEIEIPQTMPERQKIFQTTHNEPKFPITNGSLYTSIDGRVPIIHNYRRHKDRGLRPEASHLINLGVHATYLRQQELTKPIQPPKIDYSFLTCSEKKLDQPTIIKKRVSLSQNGLNRFGMASIETKANIHQLRLSKSEDSLDEIEREGFERKILLPYSKNEDTDSDDDTFSDSMNIDSKNFDSDNSSRSSFSITTEANGDFDFYQAEIRPKTPPLDFVSSHEHETFEYLRENIDTNDHKPIILQTFKPQVQRISSNKDNVTVISTDYLKGGHLDVNRNFKITRSNSKRSLENFKAYIDNDYVTCSDTDHNNYNNNFGIGQRSFSYLGLDETKNNKSKFDSPWSGIDLSYGTEYVHSLVSGGGSVPDLKKIFISDYL